MPKRKHKYKNNGGEDLYVLDKVHKRIRNEGSHHHQSHSSRYSPHPLLDRYNFHQYHDDGVHRDDEDNEADSQGRLSHQPRADLHRLRPQPAYHLGQQLSLDTKLKSGDVHPHPYGFERFINLYDSNISYRFDHFQNAEPVEWLRNIENFHNLHDDTIFRPPNIEDVTLNNLDRNVWYETYRRGQKYWDYCRDIWEEKQDRVGAALGPVASVYSLWGVSNTCLEYGGWVFIIMYCLINLFFVIPFIYAELTIGQFYRSGPLKTFERGCRLFRGVGLMMLLSCLVETAFSMTRLSWMLFYVVTSFRKGGLLWAKCGQHWNTLLCQNENPSGGKERTSAVEFYRGRVLRYWKSGWANDVGTWEPFYFNFERDESGALKGYDNPNKAANGVERYGFYEPGWFPNLDLVICLILLGLLVKKVMRMKCMALGKIYRMSFFFASLSICFCFLGRVYTTVYKAYFSAFGWFFKVDHYHHFFNPNAWVAAIRLGVISSGIGTGVYINLGSHNAFINDEIKSTALLIGFSSFGMHILTSLFFIICHFTVRTNPAFKKNPKAFGNDTFFDIFPHAVSLHPRSGFGWLVFTCMFGAIILLGLTRVMCLMHTIKQTYCDARKNYYDPIRINFDPTRLEGGLRQWRYKSWTLAGDRKEALMIYFIGGTGLFNIFTFFRGGFLYFYLLEGFWYKYVPMFILLMETTAVFFFMGVRGLNKYVRVMTTWQVTLGYRFIWKSCTFFPLLYFLLLNPGMEGFGFDGVPFSVPLLCFGYAFVGAVYFCLFFFMIKTWLGSKAEGLWSKLILESSPEHTHEDMIWSRKPSARLHWMHHQYVPSGLRKGHCRNISGVTVKYDRPKCECTMLEFLFIVLGLRKLSNLNEEMEVDFDEERNQERDLFQMKPFPIKISKPKLPPQHIPNEQIQRIQQLRKKAFVRRRHDWLKETLEFQPVSEVDKKKEEAKQKHDKKKEKHSSDSDDGSSASSSGSSSSSSGSWSNGGGGNADDHEHVGFPSTGGNSGQSAKQHHSTSPSLSKWKKLGIHLGSTETGERKSSRNTDKLVLWRKGLSARRNEESWDEFVKHAQEGGPGDD